MKIRSILAALVILLVVSPFPLGAEIIDSCVAVVNEDVITLSEVEEAGRQVFRQLSQEKMPPGQLAESMKQARRSVIEKLIEKHLVVQQAAKFKIEATEAEIDQALAQILERSGAGMEDFRAELDKMGLTEAQYRDNLKAQLLGNKLVNQMVRSRIVIPEEKIQEYYEQHHASQAAAKGKKYHILQIGIVASSGGRASGKPSAADKKAAKKKADAVRQMAVDGQDFGTLAKQHSNLPSAADSGDIGTFMEDELAEYMRSVVTSLKPDEISPVVETPEGFMLFKLVSASEGGEEAAKASYESVKDEIGDILYKQEMERHYKTWMDEIRSEAYIKIL